MTIGITYTESNYINYPRWILADDPSIEIIQLTSEHARDLAKCDGIVLSGGIDTHPRFYKSGNVSYTRAPEVFDENRDQFELDVFQFALDKKLPVLAICRGMQLVNVALGGDLIQDIEESGKSDHRRHGATDGMHEIRVEKNSLLYEITGHENGTVNSAHHQALGAVAADLVVNAYSADGIAEGAEWKDKADKTFLLCLQWHPERLAQVQPDNPFTMNIRKHFLAAIKDKQQLT